MTVSGFVSLLFNIGIKLCDICCDFHFIFYSGQKLGKTYSCHFVPKHLIFGVVFVCHRTRCGAPLFDMRVKVCLHVTFFSLCPLLPQLLNMFFLLSSEQWRENGPVTHSICYSHYHHQHNAKLNWGNNEHGLQKVTYKQTLMWRFLNILYMWG